MAISDSERTAPPSWTFLTNHAHVLLCIAADPGIRLRDVATRVGITERAVQRIVSDLEEAGYLQREREGRRNHYTVARELPLRHPIERHHNVSTLLSLVEEEPALAPAARGRSKR
ncbi:winged helix-turn-helix domain-containing protein [Pyxidicoccus parkwayensis]|uniref:Winged helix-turn-helix domain-containing protein n=1 Tax=Pyxidicoccus parkwayensis TaxID=2813578 RepID=A0ABX7NU02_9BACT|nr:winged helix-turn-helix domain-containing protein [Pyxidicoccus parkwaysis]QSQ20866.1 winged helix-turn-helix domain-containing protein [Pyxidicoccus parkwaysis]